MTCADHSEDSQNVEVPQVRFMTFGSEVQQTVEVLPCQYVDRIADILVGT